MAAWLAPNVAAMGLRKTPKVYVTPKATKAPMNAPKQTNQAREESNAADGVSGIDEVLPGGHPRLRFKCGDRSIAKKTQVYHRKTLKATEGWLNSLW
jgi:hypothetical protein